MDPTDTLPYTVPAYIYITPELRQFLFIPVIDRDGFSLPAVPPYLQYNNGTPSPVLLCLAWDRQTGGREKRWMAQLSNVLYPRSFFRSSAKKAQILTRMTNE